MIDYSSLISDKAKTIKPSGIRKFFDIVSTMEDAISLGVGEPDFQTPWQVRRAGIDSLQQGKTFYTSNWGLVDLRKEIAKYAWENYHLEYDYHKEIIVTVGGSEAIDNALRSFVSEGDEVLIPEPSFVCYTPLAIMAGGKPVPLKTRMEDGFKLTAETLKQAITPKTKVLIMPFPNNPTGALYPREVLQEIVDIAREHQLIIFADEIYDRLVMDGEEHISIASLAPDLFCVTLNGLSKSHRIAGFRVGWMCLSGDKSYAKGYIEGLNMLASMRLCSNVPAQSIVQTALGGYQSSDELLLPGGRIYEQREFIYHALNRIPGISAVKPKAAFYIFPKIDTAMYNIHNDEQFVLDFLRKEKVLLVHGGGFNWPEPDHFRVVYLPRVGELEEAMEKLEHFLKHYRQK